MVRPGSVDLAILVAIEAAAIGVTAVLAHQEGRIRADRLVLHRPVSSM
jgi:hypothetical protein